MIGTLVFLFILVSSIFTYLLLGIKENNKNKFFDKKSECLTGADFSHSLTFNSDDSFEENEKLYFSDKNTLYSFKLKDGCITRLFQFPHDIVSIRREDEGNLAITIESGLQTNSDNSASGNKEAVALETWDQWKFNTMNKTGKKIPDDERGTHQQYMSKLKREQEFISGVSKSVQIKESGIDRYEIIIDGKKVSMSLRAEKQMEKICKALGPECLKISADSGFRVSPSGKYLSSITNEIGLIIASDGSNIYLLDDKYFKKGWWMRHFFWTNEDKLVSADFPDRIQIFDFKDGEVTVQNIAHQANTSQSFNDFSNLSSDRNYYLLRNSFENNLQLLNFKTGEISTIAEAQTNMSMKFEQRIDSMEWVKNKYVLFKDEILSMESGVGTVNLRIYKIDSRTLHDIVKYTRPTRGCREDSCPLMPRFLF